MIPSLLLPSLCSEYLSLCKKLQKVADLITTYGGAVPDALDNNSSSEIPQIVESEPVSIVENIQTVPTPVIPYPKYGSWREKLIYGLKDLGKPVTAKELTLYLLHAEESSDVDSMTKKTATYLSKLDDEERIIVDKAYRPYKHSVIS